jgi:L-ascorbate metabolism protein UlaG (beta-lactamase superfamily)
MKLATGLLPAGRLALTWWGCATIALETDQHAIVIDPYLFPTEPRFEYIFCTHEHYDHVHLPTIERIAQGDVFKQAIVSRSCTFPSTFWYSRQITFLPPEQMIVFYPKYFDRERPRTFPQPTELQLAGWHVEGVESPGEEASVPFPIDGPIPQVGYVIRELASGITFFHPGDLCRSYPALADLRGKIDVFFLPLGKLGFQEDAAVLELIRPRYVIPIHYRYDNDYPIPKLYREDEPIEQQVLGHQFPGPDDPDAYIAEVSRLAAPFGVEVLPLRAGVTYEL